ncbi:DUF2188 domain-containing protein [Halomonas sp. ATCH28]|uniref:DUF2188 domain-containing protein n=1 Tax=Halomonas gemina TaxID=2945105 RepID=A0ABT0SW61_9GAMM|nr:DUF2188 domain-containing protein [Halomonas gemina]MCL7938817.1 DUF2188 domain-containing protein [Halomonas gemina]
MKPNVWVVVHPKGWAVRHENTDRVARTFETQKEAINYGRDMARREGVEFIIQGKDGAIRDRDSHGNDPFPPRG